MITTSLFNYNKDDLDIYHDIIQNYLIFEFITN